MSMRLLLAVYVRCDEFDLLLFNLVDFLCYVMMPGSLEHKCSIIYILLLLFYGCFFDQEKKKELIYSENVVSSVHSVEFS